MWPGSKSTAETAPWVRQGEGAGEATPSSRRLEDLRDFIDWRRECRVLQETVGMQTDEAYLEFQFF